MSGLMVGYIVADAGTGRILRHGLCEAADLEAQARAGEVVRQTDPAVPLDPQSERLDLEVEGLPVVDWQPPPPPSRIMVVHEWDAEQRRYVATPSAEAQAFAVRQERDRRLADSDWVALRALEQGTVVPATWVGYRQALRDVPQQGQFPESISWPVPPAE